MTSVLFIEDDHRWARGYVDCLTFAGFSVKYASTADKAIVATGGQNFDYVVTDIMMNPGEVFSDEETRGGFATGLYLARTIRARSPETQVIALSNTDGKSRGLLKDSAIFKRVLKKGEVSEEGLVDVLASLRDGRPARGLPHRAFIVHGHDERSRSRAVSQLNVRPLHRQPYESEGMVL